MYYILDPPVDTGVGNPSGNPFGHWLNQFTGDVFNIGYESKIHNPNTNLGVSENSVPLNPMVLLIIVPIKWLFVWEYTLFSDKPI